ncbi:LAFA_0G21836g1_1 [Lachancea sp. 'fantastica']|nr:LAFA_0G21836g1_1 [Lachancea sp. 'fantastica']
MTSLTGSPGKSRNPFIERYMANLGESSGQDSGLPQVNNDKENIPRKTLKNSGQVEVRPLPSPLKEITGTNQNIRSPLQWTKKKESPPMVKSSVRNEDTFDVTKLSPKDTKYYEFLCRVREAKEWISEVIGEELPSEVELISGNSLRDGVYLAKITQTINPKLVKKIVPAGTSLQYTHTQNINAFFHLVEEVGVPDLFRFELTDLYDKKNIPKVFETLHALINIINSKWPGKVPEIQNLSGRATFPENDIKVCQRKIPAIHNFRSFKVPSSGNPQHGNDEKDSLQGSAQSSPKRYQSPVKEAQDINKHSPQTPLTRTPPPRASLDIGNAESSNGTDKLSSANILTGNTPLLSFDSDISPSKSLSYYSPRIYRHLSYRSPANRSPSFRFAEDPYDLDRYGIHRYNKQEYSPVRRQRMTEIQFLDSVSSLQAICRGVNTRFGIALTQRKVDIVVEKVRLLQAQARGRMARRGPAAKSYFMSTNIDESPLRALQSYSKARLVREKIFKLRVRLFSVEDDISILQSLCRAKVVRLRSKGALAGHAILRKPLPRLQAYAKAQLQRTKLAELLREVDACRPLIVRLQGLLRAHHLRNHRKSIYFSLNERFDIVNALQSFAKGSLVRNAVRVTNTQLRHHSGAIESFAASLKGSFLRAGIKSFAMAVRDSKNPVVSMQALSRGILVRFTLELISDIVEGSDLSAIQACAKGSLIRRKNMQMSLYYRARKAQVIKVQSLIRSYQLRKAYLEFMSSANPSISSVKRFVHLINKIHASHESRSKLEYIKSQIDQSNKDRDVIEDHFELLKRKNTILGDCNIFVPHSFTENGLESTIDIRYPEYEKMLYLIQTDPFYWVTLNRLEPEFVTKHLTKTFVSSNSVMGRREAIFFMRLVSEFLAAEIESFDDPQQFLEHTGSSFWKELVSFYVHRQLPQLLVEVMSPLVEFLSLDSVAFEAVPATIYKKLHPSRPELSSSEAIEDEMTRTTFVANLMNLWKGVEIVSESLLKNAHAVPEEVKFLCTTAYKIVADHSPYQKDSLIAISRILLEALVFPVLRSPSKFGLAKFSNTAIQKIHLLSEAVDTVFSFTEFQNYLAPLNQYAEEIHDDLAFSLKNMLIFPSFDVYCDELHYSDMCQDERPSLSIPKQYLLEIGKRLHANLDAFPHDDPVNSLIEKIKMSEIKKLQDSPNSIVKLRLNPSAYHLSSSDDRLTAIYNEIKRGLVYMMQVEDVGTNLYDLMTGCIIDADEPRFQQLLQETAAIHSDPLFKNFEAITYFNLKQHVLERAYELRQMGSLSIDDNVQSILNDIANTIKSREYVVESTSKEIKTAESTLRSIQTTNMQLKDKSRALELSQKRTLGKAQASGNYAPLKKHGFGRKLKDVYHKVNNKGSGGKDCLSLEWSSRHLFELRALKDLKGENLGKAAVSFFGSSGPKFPDVNFRFSTSDGEYFAVELLDERKAEKRAGSSKTDNFQFSKLVDQLAKTEKASLVLFSNKAEFNLAPLLELIAASFIKRVQ